MKEARRTNPGDDTPNETPVAKSSSKIRIGEGEWTSPREPDDELAPSGSRRAPANLAFALGGARVHTFRASGVTGFLLAIVTMLVVAAILVAVFTFAMGVGVALAVAGAAAAALGLGGRRLRRALAPHDPNRLDGGGSSRR